MTLQIGDQAPDFTLPTDGGGSITLSAQRGKLIILYFYPKDDTPGCTTEACGFRDALPDFTGAGAVVIGISKDSVAAHDKFKAKHALNFALAADTDGRVVEQYDAWVEKSMYGKKYMGIDRCTFLIDGAGTIRGLWHKVKVAGHVEAVLEAAKALWTAPLSLRAGAVAVLTSPAPADKIALTRWLAAEWRSGRLPVGEEVTPPSHPARPPRPELLQPRDMPKRRAGGSAASRAALLHALAHIELNAIDLAWDLIARFGSAQRPRRFWDDWIGVAEEEAHHHALLGDRLAACGACYGDLPAHDGLWQAAEATSTDLLARLAVVPLVLEARGLDVTPGMIARLEQAGDHASAEVLTLIYRDEIGHVAIGRTWFEALCRERGLVPAATWHDLVRRSFKGTLKRPFNTAARDLAGFPAAFYEALADPVPLLDADSVGLARSAEQSDLQR